MLQNMREKFTGWIALAILGLIALTFVFVGVTPGFVGSNYAAKVDGEEINANYFEEAYRNQLRQNPQLAELGETLRVQVRRAVLENLIQEQLVRNYLDDGGYRISNRQVTDYIQRTPDFQVNGVFDLATYNEVLVANGLDPARYEAAQRQSLREQQLQLAIGASALVTPAEYRRYLNLVAEQRVVSVAELPQEAVINEIEVSETMIAEYSDANAGLYQLPESADIEFLAIRRADLAAAVEIGDEALAEYYEDQKYRYRQDEQRRARHILILAGDDEAAAEAKAGELLARIRAGEAFETLAAEFSADGGTASDGGNLGALTREQFSTDALAAAVFSMQPGELRGPVETEFGFHVVRLDDIVEQGALPLEQVRGELLAELQDRQAEAAFRDLERAASDALFDTDDIQAIAEATGLSVETASGITRQDAGPFGSNQAAIDAIFLDGVLTGGAVTDVVELDAGTSAIFRVTRHNPATRQTLDEVRDQVAAAILAEQAEVLLAERAAQIVAAVEAGEDFAAVAEASGATVSEPRLVGRQDPQIDQSLLFEVFAAAKPVVGAPVTGSVRNSAGGYSVYRLDAVLPGRPESIPLAERDAGKQMLARQSGQGDYIAFVRALREEANVVVNQDLLTAQDLFQ